MATHPQVSHRVHEVAGHLIQQRLRPYLEAAEGDFRAALRLYQWNIELSGATYEVLHVLEVVLRNALDRQLRRWNACQLSSETAQLHSPDWLLDPSHLLLRLTRDDIRTALNRARRALRSGKRGGREPEHDDVLAQLNFGTWRFLLPDKDPGRRLLWSQALSDAFPQPRSLTVSAGPRCRSDSPAAKPYRSSGATVGAGSRPATVATDPTCPHGDQP